jgi:hypothetical protein
MSAFDTRGGERQDARGSDAPLELDRLVHPSEQSRLVLALSATAVGFGGGGLLVVANSGWAGLAGVVILLAVVAGSAWLGFQLYRARMLGRSVRVTRESLPEVQALLDDVRSRLDYHRPVDVYVTESATPPALLTSYLGTKVIVLQGSFVADLLGQRNRAQLTFLLARFIGALKARHQRLTVVFVLIEAVTALKVLFLFLLPYRRATAYSGDQIGLAVCGDFGAALCATERLLVGKELEPELQARGMVAQAALVRRRVMPRLAQLAVSEPHLTNRYLNLLFYARRTHSGAWERFCAELDWRTEGELDRLWRRSAHARERTERRRRATAAGAVAAVVAVVAGVAGLAIASDDGRPVGADAHRAAVPPARGGEATTPAPARPPAGETPRLSSRPTPAGVDALRLHVPPAFRDSCDSIDAGDAVAAVDCTPTSGDSPGTVRYYDFEDGTAMDASFDAYATGELSPQACPDGRTTWGDSGRGGRVACYGDATGSSHVIWTDAALDILGHAETILIDEQALFRWWVASSGPVP